MHYEIEGSIKKLEVCLSRPTLSKEEQACVPVHLDLILRLQPNFIEIN